MFTNQNKKSDFCLYLATLNKKSPGYITGAYKRQSEIINSYMISYNLYGGDIRFALETVYKAYIKDPETMLMEGII